MKKILSATLLLLYALGLPAQNTNRYYPSAKSILSDPMDRHIPNDFNYYDTWIRNVLQAVFVKDLQHKSSTKGDASFDSMGLLFKRQNTFALGDSGLTIAVRKGAADFSVPVNIQLEQKNRILAYRTGFDPNSYNPKNLKLKYQLGLEIYNLSEEQVLAEFINRYITAGRDNKTTAIQRLANDLKKEAKVKLVIDEKNDRSLLTKIANQVYQTQRYASDVLYDIYIKTNDPKKEAQNFDGFFRRYGSGSPSEYIDEVVGYEATLAIPNMEISLLIPKEAVEVFTIDPKTNATLTDPEPLELKPRQVEMKTINTAKKKCVEFTLTLPKSSSTASFKALREIPLNKNIFLKPNERRLTVFKVADIQKIILSVSENEITAEMIVKYDMNDYKLVFMQQPLSLK